MIKYAVVVAIVALIIAACAAPRKTESPIPSKFYAGGGNDKHTLVIFLPGRGDDIESYERAGFIETLRSSTCPLDAVVVDAHLGYYNERTLVDRVGEDIIQTYQDVGYDEFIVVGISLGGVGALRLKFDFPELVVGTVLIAPFLGDADTIESVAAAGGLQSWRNQQHDPTNVGEEIWSWLGAMYDEQSQTIPNTIIAYGENDKFAVADDYLAKSIPSSNVFKNDGKHKWVAWSPLWSDITNSDRWENLGSDR
jgi:pimeloyl-ACP methyl ester carboxylesterase